MHEDIRTRVSSPLASGSCAIVVLFHPDVGFTTRLQAILAQFPFVILIDNTPHNGADLPNMPSSVKVLRNYCNLGIAAALNRGLALAVERGHEWVATFDQDSEILPGYLDRVIAVAAHHVPRPSLIGCNYLHETATTAGHGAPAQAAGERVRHTLITSGTFMPASFAHGIGGFREDYFIDSVDHEFCLRAHRNGAKVLMTVQPLMKHRMGKSAVKLLGFTLSLQHPAARRYYLARNTLLTLRAHGSTNLTWALRQIFRLVGEGISILFFESEKYLKISSFSRGLWHGIIGKSGSVEKI